MVVASLLKPGMVCTGAEMCISLVKVLSELEQCISAQYAATPMLHELRAASLATAPAQLQLQEGILLTMQQLFAQAQQQQKRAGKQSCSSSCALGDGPNCPAVTATSDPASATRTTGGGSPCRSCLLAHAELLAACSALLRYWPECMLDKGPVVSAWVGAAAECALHMLQDVSTAILQHQQPHADGMNGAQQQQPAPAADVLQPGLAALDLLAAVCYAAAYPDTGEIWQPSERQQLCERGALDLPCMLPSMLAVGAAVVLGQEMQRRLRRSAATCAGSGAGSAAAGADDGCRADLAAPGATAPQDQSSLNSTVAACAVPSCNGTSSGSCSSSGSGSGTHSGEVGMRPTATDAAWRLVCLTEQWAGGELLPEPFTLLLEALGCHPKAFLLLACIWQPLQGQPADINNRQHQASGSTQQSQSECSSQQDNSQVLADLCQAHSNVFKLEANYAQRRGLTASARLLQRLSCCHAKGQHQPQHTQQHLLLALLLMREALGRRTRGMSLPATAPDAARRSERLGQSALQVASAACACVSAWLCWAHLEQQEAGQEPAAAGDPAGHGRHAALNPCWALGGKSSTAVLLEVLQGHCLLLQEGARELQAVTNNWAATRSSSDSDGDNSSSNQSGQEILGGDALIVDGSVGGILRGVLGLLHALMATAAVDIGVLQQAAPHLFGLASTLEQLVRLRCACHCERLALHIDRYMPQLLQLLLGNLDLSTYAAPTQEATNAQPQQQLSRAAAATRSSLCICGLLPFLAAAAPLGGQQQRQLLGLLFSALKQFNAYPARLYTSSWDEIIQDDWLDAACDTLWAACAAGRLLLAAGGPGAWDAGTGSTGSSLPAAGRASGSTAHTQRLDSTTQGAAGGQGSSCHSCGLGAEGTAALLPWVVLQGRALQLWVALFRAYVQLPPAHAEGSKAGAKSSGGQHSHRQPYSLVGSVKAMQQVARVFEFALAPSTQLLAVVLQGAAFEGQQPLVERAQCWKLQRMREKVTVQTAMRHGTCFGHLVYGMPGFLRPGVNPGQDA